MTEREGKLWNNLTDVYQPASVYKDLVRNCNQVLYEMGRKGLIERKRAGNYWLYRLPQPKNT